MSITRAQKIEVLSQIAKLPRPVAGIVEGYIQYRLVEGYTKYPGQFLQAQAAKYYKSPDELAKICYAAFEDTEQNGVSCMLNALEPLQRTECINLLTKDHPLLGCYFKSVEEWTQEDIGSMKSVFIKFYQQESDRPKHNLPTALINALEIKAEFSQYPALRGYYSSNKGLHLNFRGIVFTGGYIFTKDFRLTDFSYTSFVETSLYDWDCTGSDFTGAIFGYESTLSDCIFSYGIFRMSEIKSSSISSCIFTNTDISSSLRWIRTGGALEDTTPLERYGNDFREAKLGQESQSKIIESIAKTRVEIAYEVASIWTDILKKLFPNPNDAKKCPLPDALMLQWLSGSCYKPKELAKISRLTQEDLKPLSPALQNILKKHKKEFLYRQKGCLARFFYTFCRSETRTEDKEEDAQAAVRP